jgi:chromosome segregation ATPase
MDVEARDDLLDRLRSRLAMLERELRESQRIAQVQVCHIIYRADVKERAFESERTSLQAQEAHLNSRIRQLKTTTKLVAPSSSPSETLQEDLDSLRSSHSTLLGQLDRLSNEVQELRGENGRLKEENEGWEYLVREQTFSNRLFQREEKEDEGGRYMKSHLDVLDEEMDEEMTHLHSELEAQSPTEEIFPRSTPISRQPSSRMGRDISGPSIYSEGVGMTSRNISGVSSMYTEEPVEGMDLAAEFGRADLGPVILDAVGEEMNVEKENKRLREEVKALQLYCSKVSSFIDLADDRLSTGLLRRMDSSISSMSIIKQKESVELVIGVVYLMWSR